MDKPLGGIIARLRKSKSLTQAELARKICEHGAEVTHLYISKWEQGYSLPSVKQFLALCAALDVKDIQWEFAGRHTGLLAGFNEEGRKKAIELLNLLFKIDEYRDEPEGYGKDEPRLLKLYSIGVSAGKGNFLDESDYELIETPDYVSTAADWAVRISGDSMTPLYQDRQIIWVREQSGLNDGEIGIFFLNNSSYCKKYVPTRDGILLRSLNTAYEDIAISGNDVFKILGKVIS